MLHIPCAGVTCFLGSKLVILFNKRDISAFFSTSLPRATSKEVEIADLNVEIQLVDLCESTDSVKKALISYR